MNMKMLYNWISEIKSIGKHVLVSIGVSDVACKAIELRVDFEDFQGKKYGCFEAINIENENIPDWRLFKALNKIKSFMKSSCLFKKQ